MAVLQTNSRTLGTVTESGFGEPTGAVADTRMLARLRDAAGRLAPFSEERLLLRGAASVIERLGRETERLEAELARVTAELTGGRTRPRTP
jgi:hypothetical protein